MTRAVTAIPANAIEVITSKADTSRNKALKLGRLLDVFLAMRESVTTTGTL